MDEKDKITLAEKYRLLIQARNFHYENFNKWMTYFYVAISALFVGYCTVVASQKSLTAYQNIIPLLGFIVSLLWYWSSKGYYYWNINFITLVNHYEKSLLKFDENERIYFVFANKKKQNNYLSPISGANISTSKVAILLAFIITAFWGFVFFNNIINYYFCNCLPYIVMEIVFSIFSIIILSDTIPNRYLFSKNDHFPDLKIEE